jgi:HNH endonuclease
LSAEVLTAARVRELLIFDPASGELRWKARPITRSHDKSWNTQHADKAAGCLQSRGYRQIHIDGRFHLAPNVVWLFVHGEWPVRGLDHINLDPADNRIANLRLATTSESAANRRRPRNNTSGKKGVYRFRGKWHATITKDYQH